MKYVFMVLYHKYFAREFHIWRLEINIGCHYVCTWKYVFFNFELSFPNIITSVIFIIEQKVRQFWKAPFVSISKLSYFSFYVMIFGEKNIFLHQKGLSWTDERVEASPLYLSFHIPSRPHILSDTRPAVGPFS